jgi:hypothetical protein
MFNIEYYLLLLISLLHRGRIEEQYDIMKLYTVTGQIICQLLGIAGLFASCVFI